MATPLNTRKKIEILDVLKRRFSELTEDRAEFLSVLEALARLMVNDAQVNEILFSYAKRGKDDPTAAITALWGLSRRLEPSGDKPIFLERVKKRLEHTLQGTDTKARELAHRVLKYRFGYSETYLRALEVRKPSRMPREISFVVEPDADKAERRASVKREGI